MASITSQTRETNARLRPAGHLETDGFTVKSLLKNAKVFILISLKFDILLKLSSQVNAPPPAEATRIRNSKPTAFRKFYERGDFPIALEHDTKGNKIAWKVF
jgi:hypothetical protein